MDGEAAEEDPMDEGMEGEGKDDPMEEEENTEFGPISQPIYGSFSGEPPVVPAGATYLQLTSGDAVRPSTIHPPMMRMRSP